MLNYNDDKIDISKNFARCIKCFASINVNRNSLRGYKQIYIYGYNLIHYLFQYKYFYKYDDQKQQSARLQMREKDFWFADLIMKAWKIVFKISKRNKSKIYVSSKNTYLPFFYLRNYENYFINNIYSTPSIFL